MTIRAIYDKQEDIPSGLEDYYDEKEGQFYLQRVEGLRSDADFTRLSDALKKERSDHKAAKKRLKALPEGFDPEKFAEDQAELEELRLQVGERSDEKIEQMVEARLKRKTGPMERELVKLREALVTSEQTASQLQARINASIIDDAIVQATVKTKLHPTAIADAKLLGSTQLQIGEDGKVSTEDGKSPEEWLLALRESRAHWFPASTPGGARGGSGAPGESNPWSRQSWNLTAQSAITAKRGVQYASKLAEQAGSKFGATSPPKE